MSINSLTGLVLLSLVIFFSACNNEITPFEYLDPDRKEISPTKVIITSLEFDRLSPIRGANGSWETDGTGPDLYLEIMINGSLFYRSDTIFDLPEDNNVTFAFDDTITLTRSDTSFIATLWDDDPAPPGVPPVFNSRIMFYQFSQDIWTLSEPPYYDDQRYYYSFGPLVFRFTYQYLE